MPDPITTQLINTAWNDIEDAVTSGLAIAAPYRVPRPALETVAVVATEKINATNGRHASGQAPDAPPHVRVEPGDAFDIMHHYDLSYHELYAPDTEAIRSGPPRPANSNRTWRCESTKVGEVRSLPDRPSRTGPTLTAGDNAGAWCSARPSPTSGRDRPQRTVKVDIKSENGIQAMVYRVAGGPYARRPRGLSLSWTPLDH